MSKYQPQTLGTMSSSMDDTGHGLTSGTGMGKHYTHMTFFWGKNSEILFSGWPGTRGGMYALALIVVLVLGILVEWCSRCRMIPKPAQNNHIAAGLVKTAVHAVRVGLAYLLMLALMSFNVGVLIAAILGHVLGFLLFGSCVFCPSRLADGTKGDIPLCSC